MDAFLQAIADPHRRTIVDALRIRSATVNELADLLPIARPGVSRHLRVLREAGVVESRADAQRRIYSLRTEPLVELDDWLEEFRALWRQRFDALHTEVARGRRNRRAESASGAASAGRPDETERETDTEERNAG